MATTCSKTEYAVMKGVSPAAITKAIAAGRVVVLPTGRVDVDASDMLWERRTDPLQSMRANAPKRRAEALAAIAAGSAGRPEQPELNRVIYDFETARAKLQTHQANIAEMEERKRAGELCETAVVVRTLTTTVANFRTSMERVADKLADRLAAESSPHACHQILIGEITSALGQLAADCDQVAQQIAEASDGRA